MLHGNPFIRPKWFFILEALRLASRAVPLLKPRPAQPSRPPCLFWTLPLWFLFQGDVVTALSPQSTCSDRRAVRGCPLLAGGIGGRCWCEQTGCLYQIRWSRGPQNKDLPNTEEVPRMAGDQLTHGEAVAAGLTSVAELSSVLPANCRPGVATHTGCRCFAR